MPRYRHLPDTDGLRRRWRQRRGCRRRYRLGWCNGDGHTRVRRIQSRHYRADAGCRDTGDRRHDARRCLLALGLHVIGWTRPSRERAELRPAQQRLYLHASVHLSERPPACAADQHRHDRADHVCPDGLRVSVAHGRFYRQNSHGRQHKCLAYTKHVGILSHCNYEMQTHDQTGIIHIDAPAFKTFTLGQFFDIWGQPLTSTNVAGVTGTVVAYINDNGDSRRYMGDLRNIELTSLRDITLQIGTPVSTLATYSG